MVVKLVSRFLFYFQYLLLAPTKPVGHNIWIVSHSLDLKDYKYQQYRPVSISLVITWYTCKTHQIEIEITNDNKSPFKNASAYRLVANL